MEILANSSPICRRLGAFLARLGKKIIMAKINLDFEVNL